MTSEQRNDGRRSLVENDLKNSFDQSFPDRVERYLRVKVHDYVSLTFFSHVVAECREMFASGYFYGSISLSQAYAEALARFIAEKFEKSPPRDYKKNVQKLSKRKLITEDVADAFLAIHGKDRNNFHHFNKEIEDNIQSLETRAEDCLKRLNTIESNIFAYSWTEQGFKPKYAKYWHKKENGEIAAYVRPS